jgi:hypothetical protein
MSTRTRRLIASTTVATAALLGTAANAQDASITLDMRGLDRQLQSLHQDMGRLAQHLPVHLQLNLDGLDGLDNLDSLALGFAGQSLERERVVKGAPYCATAVHERIQALADGNRIVKRQSTELCRDGEGRTRRVVRGDDGKQRVYLRDPVSKESWVLDPERKTARQLRGLSLVAGGVDGMVAEHEARLGQLGERLAQQSERWSQWAQQVAQRAREGWQRSNAAIPAASAVPSGSAASDAAEPAVIIESSSSKDGKPATREVRVIRLSDLPKLSDLPPMPPMPPMPPVPAMPDLPPLSALPEGLMRGIAHIAPRGEGVTTALAAKDMDGLRVNGERTTWTIEAGKLGNEKPIVITREVWRSPELMLTVSSRDADPRTGEQLYRLEKLKRGEPDAALMKVPADYATKPAPGATKRPSATSTGRA